MVPKFGNESHVMKTLFSYFKRKMNSDGIIDVCGFEDALEKMGFKVDMEKETVRMFKKFNVNNDGKFKSREFLTCLRSRYPFAELLDLFKRKQGDKTISVEDGYEIFQELGMDFPYREVKRHLQRFAIGEGEIGEHRISFLGLWVATSAGFLYVMETPASEPPQPASWSEMILAIQGIAGVVIGGALAFVPKDIPKDLHSNTTFPAVAKPMIQSISKGIAGQDSSTIFGVCLVIWAGFYLIALRCRGKRVKRIDLGRIADIVSLVPGLVAMCMLLFVLNPWVVFFAVLMMAVVGAFLFYARNW